MDDIIDIGMEVEVNEDLTCELEDHFDHQSEGAIISKPTKIEFYSQNQPSFQLL